MHLDPGDSALTGLLKHNLRPHICTSIFSIFTSEGPNQEQIPLAWTEKVYTIEPLGSENQPEGLHISQKTIVLNPKLIEPFSII
jgi:hypothetical protein